MMNWFVIILVAINIGLAYLIYRMMKGELNG